MNIYADEKGVHLNSRTYIGESTQMDLFDVGRQKYDGKILHYPGGKYQIVKASNSVFRVPIPLGLKKTFQQWYDPEEDEEKDSSGKKQRLDNIFRAEKRIQQIILLNEWKYFLTLTFNDDVVDASDVEKVTEKTQSWLKNQTYRIGVGYLLVPEYHKKDKRIHMHALINGDLKVESSGTYKVKDIKKPVSEETIKRYKIASERILYPVFNCNSWKYGFSTAIEVYGNPNRLACYVLKYMTKDSSNIFKKSYWCSKNLKLYPDTELIHLPSGDYDNTPGRVFYHRASSAAYKYINRLGEELNDELSDEVALKL